MGQEEVIRVLKKSGKWLISTEIAKLAGYSLTSIQSNLKRLIKWGHVKKEKASEVISDPKRLEKRSYPGYAYKIKEFKTLDDFKFKGKKVLIRIDVNSPVVNNKIVLNDRFKEHAKTVRELISEGAKVAILAHQGRPGESDFRELKEHAVLLSKEIGKEVRYVDDLFGKGMEEAVRAMKNGDVIMLKNVRDYKEENKDVKGEEHAKNEFVTKLSKAFDIYVNDAFSMCYRSHASVVGFAKVMPSCAGRVLEREYKSLERIKEGIKKPVIYILGGVKIEEVEDLMRAGLQNKKVDVILTGGLLGPLCLIADGKDLGEESEFLKEKGIIASSNLSTMVKESKEIKMPIDFVMESGEEVSIENFPVSQKVMDIGSKTIKLYLNEIKGAGTILVKGPMGVYEEERFRKGTNDVFEAVANSKAFKVLGGGDSRTALNLIKISKEKFDYVSLSGGALVEFMAGRDLPGLDVLKVEAK